MSTDTEQPMGVIYNMPAEKYHAVEALSATGMRHLARSPWHYRNRVDIVPTKPMLNGTLAHCAILEPHAMDSRYVVVPEDAPRRPSKTQWAAKNPSPDSVAAMAWWKTFNSSCLGLEIVAAEDYAITALQLAAIQDDAEISALLATGAGEVSVFWTDRATGVYCKARPDWVKPIDARRMKVIDLKTAADDTPEGFARSAARLGYHRQRAHYIAGMEACGLKVEDFMFAVVSSAPPVLATAYRLVDDVAQQGEEECAELLQLYAECMRTGKWPAYTPEDRMIDFPKWAKRSQEVEVGYA